MQLRFRKVGGHYDYIERMAEDKNLIMFIREIDKPTQSFYTVDFNKDNNQINQCRGYENSNELRWDEVDVFTKEWLKKIPYLKSKKKKEEKVIEHGNFNGQISQRPGTETHEQRSSFCAI